jgi:hypothetical protein
MARVSKALMASIRAHTWPVCDLAAGECFSGRGLFVIQQVVEPR